MANSGNVFNWSELIPASQWQVYRDGLSALEQRRLRFALGGGYAFSAYSHRWRNTKDLDIYVLPEDREAVVDALTAAGFDDYYEQASYDRSWSYRSIRDGTIIDVLWAMCNHVASVEETWLTLGPELDVRGMRLRLLPVEKLVWLKLYVFQRERCDWPDLLNILFTQGPTLDWGALLAELGQDRLLLGGLLAVFRWMCAAQAQELPKWIWSEVGVNPPLAWTDCWNERQQVAILNGNDWFGPKTS